MMMEILSEKWIKDGKQNKKNYIYKLLFIQYWKVSVLAKKAVLTF